MPTRLPRTFYRHITWVDLGGVIMAHPWRVRRSHDGRVARGFQPAPPRGRTIRSAPPRCGIPGRPARSEAAPETRQARGRRAVSRAVTRTACSRHAPSRCGRAASRPPIATYAHSGWICTEGRVTCSGPKSSDKPPLRRCPYYACLFFYFSQNFFKNRCNIQHLGEWEALAREVNKELANDE